MAVHFRPLHKCTRTLSWVCIASRSLPKQIEGAEQKARVHLAPLLCTAPGRLTVEEASSGPPVPPALRQPQPKGSRGMRCKTTRSLTAGSRRFPTAALSQRRSMGSPPRTTRAQSQGGHFTKAEKLAAATTFWKSSQLHEPSAWPQPGTNTGTRSGGFATLKGVALRICSKV